MSAIKPSNLLSRITPGSHEIVQDSPSSSIKEIAQRRLKLASRLSDSMDTTPSVLPTLSTNMLSNVSVHQKPGYIRLTEVATPVGKPSLSILGAASLNGGLVVAPKSSNDPTPLASTSRLEITPSLPSPALAGVTGPFSGLSIRGVASKPAPVRANLSFKKALQDLVPAPTATARNEVKEDTQSPLSIRGSSSSLLARFKDGPNRASPSAQSLRDRMR